MKEFTLKLFDIRGFWNDKEGLTLHEFIALWVMIIWAATMVSIGIVALILTLKDKPLSNFWLQYLDMFCDIPLAVIIGLFGINFSDGLGEGIGKGLSNLKQFKQEQKYEPTVSKIQNIDDINYENNNQQKES